MSHHISALRCLVAVFLVALGGGCSTRVISSRVVTRSEPAAVALLKASQNTYGAASFRKAHSISVKYEGKWASIGPRFQPVLADTRFRGGSREMLNLDTQTMRQVHTGPAGTKEVVRSPGKIHVTYNGIASADPEIQRAAALVADAYTLFLTGPFYFDRAGVVLASEPSATIDGKVCDQILAILKPGFGFAEEDRVLLSIDRTTRQLLRIRTTLNGLDSTVGAEVDVTFRDFRRIDGILWATDFDERIRVPFKLHAHHWRTADLEVSYKR